MKRQFLNSGLRSLWPIVLLAVWSGAGLAQVAVPDIEEMDELPMISAAEIEELVEGGVRDGIKASGNLYQAIVSSTRRF